VNEKQRNGRLDPLQQVCSHTFLCLQLSWHTQDRSGNIFGHLHLFPIYLPSQLQGGLWLNMCRRSLA